MRPVTRSRTFNAVSTPGPLAPPPALPNMSSTLGKAPQPLDKRPVALEKPPALSSKRPRVFTQMPFQAGLVSAAKNLQAPVPQQTAAQAEKDPFPMDDGWDSLELFDSHDDPLSHHSVDSRGRFSTLTASTQMPLQADSNSVLERSPSPDFSGSDILIPLDISSEVQNEKSRIWQTIAQCVEEVQAVEQAALKDRSRPDSLAKTLAVIPICQSVYEQAAAVKDESTSLDDLEEAQSKCNAWKKEVLELWPTQSETKR